MEFWLLGQERGKRGAGLLLALIALSAGGASALSGQVAAVDAHGGDAVLVDAPEPQMQSNSPTPKANPCPEASVFTGWFRSDSDEKAAMPGSEGAGVHPALVPCQKRPLNAYQRFVNGPTDSPLTPRDKGWLAARDAVDPFNMITILGEAGISVGFDSHSPYGPGMPGYGRYVGVSFAQDLTGEFFGTFLIPSLTHQDPRYHRMLGRSVPRRAFHAVAQIFWTQSDTGEGMLNYANLVGFAIDDEISNLYVPGRQTDAQATGERYAIGLATAPIGNFVTEFLPDVASHLHVQIVVLQRIINQVARTGMPGGTSQAGDTPGED
ncbi:MAG TPA: hypothetical protein VGJ21_22835 [Terracidiphilus sp.]|jgi:hypothetical protein